MDIQRTWLYRAAWVGLLFVAVPALCQKVKVGYDKSVDFSRYKTYTTAPPAVPPQRPLLYESIVNSIQVHLESRHLLKDDANPDLILVTTGGVDLGINSGASTPALPSYSGPPPAIDSTMWTGSGGQTNLTARYVAQGALTLTFIDRNSHKIVWSGTVSDKLDPHFERDNKALKRIDEAIVKLLSNYPPKKQ